jgi:protocatechuate 3,4-dioxygenase beta subunit
MLKKFRKTSLVLLCIVLQGCWLNPEVRLKEVDPDLRMAGIYPTQSDIVKSVDVTSCPITPPVYEDVTIPEIYKTNNLRRRTGYATYAKGEFIRITGIVTDSNCVPISNATVQIWHADSKGYYKSLSVENYLNDDMMYSVPKDRFQKTYRINKDSDKNFTGSGSTSTDNLGRFTFLSIMPGKVEGKDPVVMFRILHKDFNELSTVMYFPENTKTTNKAEFISEILDDGASEKIYMYKITLLGTNKYLGY